MSVCSNRSINTILQDFFVAIHYQSNLCGPQIPSYTLFVPFAIEGEPPFIYIYSTINNATHSCIRNNNLIYTYITDKAKASLDLKQCSIN